MPPVDNGPSGADIAVDAALGDLVRCAYHDRWLRARLQIVENHIRDLRCENAQLRGDLAAAYCRMDDIDGRLGDSKPTLMLTEIERLRAEVAFLERLVMNVAVRCVRDPEVAEDMVADEREQMRS